MGWPGPSPGALLAASFLPASAQRAELAAAAPADISWLANVGYLPTDPRRLFRQPETLAGCLNTDKPDPAYQSARSQVPLHIEPGMLPAASDYFGGSTCELIRSMVYSLI